MLTISVQTIQDKKYQMRKKIAASIPHTESYSTTSTTATISTSTSTTISTSTSTAASATTATFTSSAIIDTKSIPCTQENRSSDQTEPLPGKGVHRCQGKIRIFKLS